MKNADTEYLKMSQAASPPSPVAKDCLLAFLFGGLLCVLGEAVVLLARQVGFSETTASLLASLTLIALSVTLTGCQVYDNVAKHAGAGTLVPITGFANSVAAPAIEFKREGFVTGLGVKMFTIAGPVLVYGISASVLYGLILCLIRLF